MKQLFIDNSHDTHAHLHLQLLPLQRGAFTGTVRETHALDWYR